MPRWLPYALGAGALVLLFFGGGTEYSYGGAPVRAGVDRDPNKLLSGFAKKLERVFRRMRAQGYDPFFWEGYRTPSRAAQEAAQGDGIADSIHSYRAAGDIVDGARWKLGLDPWTNVAPGFWDALRDAAEAEGLTSGARFSKVDRPHVQAPTVKQQVAFRAMTDVQRAQVVA